MIQWPGVEEDQLEKVTEETVEKDAFQKNVFAIEKTGDGGAKICVKFLVDVELTPEVLETMLSSREFSQELTETVIQRLLLDMNVSLMPVMQYKIDDFKNKIFRLN